MQYRNLNLDKLQAFAPERKMIDKENIYNAFLGLGDALQKGADAYTLNKIYQLSPDEQQRKMAEFRGYKGDFSGFDNIEQTKLRQAEMNALREQQRVDKEEEDIATERANENTYKYLASNRIALFAELQKRMKDYNAINASTTKYNNIHDLETQKRFLQNEDSSLLKEFNENTNQLNILNHKKKVADASIDDIFKYDVNMNKNIQSDVLNTDNNQNTNTENTGLIEVTQMVFDTDEKRDSYLNDEKLKSGLSDTQKPNFSETYINSRYKKHAQKTIIDDNFTELKKSKLKDLGYETITQDESNKRKKNDDLKSKQKNVATAIKKNEFTFGTPPDGISDEEVIKWAEEVVKGFSGEANDKLNEIFNNYKYNSGGN